MQRMNQEEGLKKSTISRQGPKAQRKTNANFLNFFAHLCDFAPLREAVWLFKRFTHSFEANVETRSFCGVAALVIALAAAGRYGEPRLGLAAAAAQEQSLGASPQAA